MLAKGVDSPIGLIGCRVNERPCLLDEFDQTTLETQPLALKRIGRVALCADLADQLDKSRGLGMRRYKCQRILFETNPF
jgi:hypothetical protein